MVTVTFLGHSCFQITDNSHSVIIDPFLSGNPVAVLKPDAIKVDAVLLTHGHGDHFGDTIEIVKRNNALVIAVFELAKYCEQKGLQTHGMHIGGSHVFSFGKVKFTPALHGSSIIEDDETIRYMGNPAGIVLTMGEKTIYHAGDTGLFMDMELIGKMNLDAALLPIGDNYTMGVDDAVEAVKILHPKIVIPMHYNTFDLIKADPDDFSAKVQNYSTKCVILKPGEGCQIN